MIKTSRLVVTLNVEQRQPNLAQVLTHLPEFPLTKTVSTFQFGVTGDEMDMIEPDIRIIDTTTGTLTPISDYWKKHSVKAPLPKKTHFKFTSQGSKLSGTSTSDIGISSNFDLVNTIDDPPRSADQTLNWDSIKNFVADSFLNRPMVVFRGQPDNRQKLRTLFHHCKQQQPTRLSAL
jgi:hypothetical protein